LDGRPTLLETIKVNVCCALLDSRLHELVVQNVKIVAPEGLAMVAKNAKQVNIAHHRQTIPRPVSHAVLEGINRTLRKRAAFHAHQENTSILEEKRNVKTVKLDVRLVSLATIKANVCCVPLVKRLHELAAQIVKIVVLEDTVMVVKNVKLVNIASLP
jgi:hypothetical protein